MSRIEQALRRVSGDPIRSDLAPAQGQFEAAWDVGTRVATVANEPPVTTVSTPASVDRVPQVSFSSAWRERLAEAPDGDPVLIEQFRRLAGVLHQARRSSGLRRFMVTSAVPGDGKTLTAVNLALVLAGSYRSEVLLIDADLRCPSIPAVVELGERAGLTEALLARTERPLALVKVAPGLTVLPAGQPIANSIEALTSPRMQEIIDEAQQRFDWVILDAPPVGATADARLLAELVGGALFVVHAGRTPFADIQKAIESLGRDRILGVVLNGAESDSITRYHYGYYQSTNGKSLT